MASLMVALVAVGTRVDAQTTTATGTTYVVAAKGDKTPDGLDTLQNTDSFALHGNTTVFIAYLAKAQVSAVFSSTLTSKTEILRVGNTYGAAGKLTGFAGNLCTNANGQALLYGLLTDAGGIERDALLLGSNTANTRPIVVADQGTPDGNGQFNSFSPGTVNDAGQVAFSASIKNGGGPVNAVNGIYRWRPDGSVTQIARTGQFVPGESNPFLSLNGDLMNQAGQVCFSAWINDPQGVNGYGYGLYRTDGAANITKLGRSGEPAPGTPYFFTDFQVGRMNEAGAVSFYGYLADRTRSVQTQGIFKATGSSDVVPIAFVGQTAPDGLGVYTSLDNSIGINNAGQVAYVGYFQNGSVKGSGVFIGDGVTQRCLVLAGQTAPDGSKYKDFALSRAGDGGTVAFMATTDNASNLNAIYLTDGAETVKVVRAGDTVSGAKVNQVGFAPNAFNTLQQIVYQGGASSASLKVLLFAPALNWRTNGDGSWADPANWTASLVPSVLNDVSLAPAAGGRIVGPSAAVTVRSLKVGGGANGTAELGMRAGAVTAAGGVTVAPLGRLSGSGRVVGDVTNQGTIAPGTAVGALTVQGNYTQAAAGALEVEVGGPGAAAYDALAVAGSATLTGTLKFSLVDDAVGQLNAASSLTVLSTTGTLGGTFANAANGARISTSDGLASFQVNYTAHAVILNNFAAVDADADSVPDAWTQRYFGHPTGQAGDRSRAGDDADGDGTSNLAEFLAGTDPTRSASALRAQMSTAAGGTMSLTFPTVTGRTYAVESATQPGGANWLPIMSGIAGDGTTKTVTLGTVPAGQRAGFYRVSVARQ